MPPHLIERIRTLLRGIFASDTDSEDDDSHFTPSLLDAGVLFAHGKGNEAEREIDRIRQQAEQLEDQHRDQP